MKNSSGYEDRPGSGRFNSVDFAPRGLRLRNPVHVTAAGHRALFTHVRAFTAPSRGTIHRLAADEWRSVLRAIVAANPAQRRQIERWLETVPK